jgi:hypothetical protein
MDGRNDPCRKSLERALADCGARVAVSAVSLFPNLEHVAQLIAASRDVRVANSRLPQLHFFSTLSTKCR